MPELPEVETVRRILIKNLVGKKINNTFVYYNGVLENVTKEEFITKLQNETFRDVLRLGKYLIFILDTKSLIVHLRMEGKFYFKAKEDLLSPHEHIEFVLNDLEVLRYHDTRKFGKFVLLDTTDMHEIIKYPSVAKLGPDANIIENKDEIFKKILEYKGTLKACLLDQTVMAGIGNIYADEICFLTKLHPEVKCNNLEESDVLKIIDAAREVLDLAISQGGTTIRSYTSSLGVTGRFQQSLLVHSKEGELCSRCGSIIIKTRVAGRGTYFCPTCQKIKNEIKVVGLTGVIASGKTEATNYLRKLSYKVIDADEINRDILDPKSKHYKKLLEKIQTVFPDAVCDNVINKRKLREIIFENSTLRIELENIVYPVIKNIIINEIKKEKFDIINNKKQRILFVSAPLLLESDFDDVCNDLIIFDVSEELQIERIMKRDAVSYDAALTAKNLRMTLAELVTLGTNKGFKPKVISNNETLKELQNKIDQTLQQIMED